jgi:hypothetical protein
LQLAAAKNWRAAAWLLERTQPERFAKHDTKLFRPDEVEELWERLIEVVADEIEDPALCDRVYHRLLASMQRTMREWRDAERTRRDPRRARRMMAPAVVARPTAAAPLARSSPK